MRINIPFKIVLGILTFVPYFWFLISFAELNFFGIPHFFEDHVPFVEVLIFVWAVFLFFGYLNVLITTPHLKRDTKAFWLFLFAIASFISIPVFYFVNVLRVKD